jgi:hypothetical protein
MSRSPRTAKWGRDSVRRNEGQARIATALSMTVACGRHGYGTGANRSLQASGSHASEQPAPSTRRLSREPSAHRAGKGASVLAPVKGAFSPSSPCSPRGGCARRSAARAVPGDTFGASSRARGEDAAGMHACRSSSDVALEPAPRRRARRGCALRSRAPHDYLHAPRHIPRPARRHVGAGANHSLHVSRSIEQLPTRFAWS